ncbi:MAG: carboxylating nicotinate-nucleotide diphosphorylase [Rhodospirillaceae bacterium]|nr:carboxylating nicotinate-nucleotide diphosphorylase [Rhodospirillaceae bacterium]MBT5299024.1 carboxylating nicotinate-nucleotide diphosphorylase [Rhodospirillaceae bacterium]MBT5514911.1 carboxylating nicotinate-nucleotide diphosphorylase [Rhodospirillaceae bacterium]MBT6086135.1 carboxylating nicotinate-nucleotide diphosphorylase [Rhodospirillaceae bacterium]MBT6608186.1 carboxylating nicotinate-nucleotide diphosphorylase [Rhodospirillaceae bacterium]
MPEIKLSPADYDSVIDAALAEDVGAGDVTTRATIPAGRPLAGVLSARSPMVVAGLPVATAVFARVDPLIEFTPQVADGDRINPGQIIAEVAGPAESVLTGERTALNILHMLSAIATETRRYVDAIAGTGCTLLDTRKTIPGLRALSKYAVRCGGGTNHRMRLDDAILIKDNHIAVAGGISQAITQAIAADTGLKVQAECDTLDQVRDAIAAGADSLLLDNMDTDTLRRAVDITAGRVPLEASGGVRLDTIRAIAETGVDFASVGAITQYLTPVDIGLDLET